MIQVLLTLTENKSADTINLTASEPLTCFWTTDAERVALEKTLESLFAETKQVLTDTKLTIRVQSFKGVWSAEVVAPVGIAEPMQSAPTAGPMVPVGQLDPEDEVDKLQSAHDHDL